MDTSTMAFVGAGRTAAEWLSRAMGWGYVTLWAGSFVPQIIHSQQTRDMSGVSTDYLWLNVVAFTCFLATSVALLSSSVVRNEYSHYHDGYFPIARWNDVAFAIWALLCAGAQLTQAALFRSTANHVSGPTFVSLITMALIIFVGLLATPLTAEKWWLWLDYVNVLALIKVYITLVKYLPQATLNWRRQSTEGYRIENVGADFGGGILSLMQLVLDAAIAGDWSGVTGHPAKLYVPLFLSASWWSSTDWVVLRGTGVITLLMDGLLIGQWVKYDRSGKVAPEGAVADYARNEEEASWYDGDVEHPTERTSLLGSQVRA